MEDGTKEKGKGKIALVVAVVVAASADAVATDYADVSLLVSECAL